MDVDIQNEGGAKRYAHARIVFRLRACFIILRCSTGLENTAQTHFFASGPNETIPNQKLHAWILPAEIAWSHSLLPVCHKAQQHPAHDGGGSGCSMSRVAKVNNGVSEVCECENAAFTRAVVWQLHLEDFPIHPKKQDFGSYHCFPNAQTCIQVLHLHERIFMS